METKYGECPRHQFESMYNCSQCALEKNIRRSLGNLFDWKNCEEFPPVDGEYYLIKSDGEIVVEQYKNGYWNSMLNVEQYAKIDRWIPASIKPPENIGVLVFIPDEDNHKTSGMWDVSQKWVLLDEYRIPEREVTHWMMLPDDPTN